MNSGNLAISVVVPLYNKAETILKTIASVQAQSFDNWELVIIDDGSTDDGPHDVASLADERIRLIRQANAGVSAARNRGIIEARYEFVAFLDADDFWMPDYLQVIASLVTDFPQAQWFATSYLVRHPNKSEYQARLRGVSAYFNRGVLEDYFTVASQSDPPVCSSATVVKRDAILSIGGFPEGFSDGEDLITWARLACRYALAYDSRPMAVYDFAGLSRPPDPYLRVAQELVQMHRQHPQSPSLRAYVGLWHRMQAVKAMRFDDAALARRCSWSAFIYGPRQWRNAYTLMLVWLPPGLRHRVDTFLRRLAG